MSSDLADMLHQIRLALPAVQVPLAVGGPTDSVQELQRLTARPRAAHMQWSRSHRHPWAHAGWPPAHKELKFQTPALSGGSMLCLHAVTRSNHSVVPPFQVLTFAACRHQPRAS